MSNMVSGRKAHSKVREVLTKAAHKLSSATKTVKVSVTRGHSWRKKFTKEEVRDNEGASSNAAPKSKRKSSFRVVIRDVVLRISSPETLSFKGRKQKNLEPEMAPEITKIARRFRLIPVKKSDMKLQPVCGQIGQVSMSHFFSSLMVIAKILGTKWSEKLFLGLAVYFSPARENLPEPATCEVVAISGVPFLRAYGEMLFQAPGFDASIFERKILIAGLECQFEQLCAPACEKSERASRLQDLQLCDVFLQQCAQTLRAGAYDLVEVPATVEPPKYAVEAPADPIHSAELASTLELKRILGVTLCTIPRTTWEHKVPAEIPAVETLREVPAQDFQDGQEEALVTELNDEKESKPARRKRKRTRRGRRRGSKSPKEASSATPETETNETTQTPETSPETEKFEFVHLEIVQKHTSVCDVRTQEEEAEITPQALDTETTESEDGISAEDRKAMEVSLAIQKEFGSQKLGRNPYRRGFYDVLTEEDVSAVRAEDAKMGKLSKELKISESAPMSLCTDKIDAKVEVATKVEMATETVGTETENTETRLNQDLAEEPPKKSSIWDVWDEMDSREQERAKKAMVAAAIAAPEQKEAPMEEVVPIENNVPIRWAKENKWAAKDKTERGSVKSGAPPIRPGKDLIPARFPVFRPVSLTPNPRIPTQHGIIQVYRESHRVPLPSVFRQPLSPIAEVEEDHESDSANEQPEQVSSPRARVEEENVVFSCCNIEVAAEKAAPALDASGPAVEMSSTCKNVDASAANCLADDGDNELENETEDQNPEEKAELLGAEDNVDSDEEEDPDQDSEDEDEDDDKESRDVKKGKAKCSKKRKKEKKAKRKTRRGRRRK